MLLADGHCPLHAIMINSDTKIRIKVIVLLEI